MNNTKSLRHLLILTPLILSIPHLQGSSPQSFKPFTTQQTSMFNPFEQDLLTIEQQRLIKRKEDKKKLSDHVFYYIAKKIMPKIIPMICLSTLKTNLPSYENTSGSCNLCSADLHQIDDYLFRLDRNPGKNVKEFTMCFDCASIMVEKNRYLKTFSTCQYTKKEYLPRDIQKVLITYLIKPNKSFSPLFKNENIFILDKKDEIEVKDAWGLINRYLYPKQTITDLENKLQISNKKNKQKEKDVKEICQYFCNKQKEKDEIILALKQELKKLRSKN